MQGQVFDELGFYLLAGDSAGPAELVEEACRGEELGLGTAFLAERWKMSAEAATLSGAACSVTTRLRVGTAATNHNLRHPVVNASWAATMHRLSGGRFTLGIGAGVRQVYRSFGLPPVTTAQMRDWAGLMRRLWNGETIRDHSGPAGDYPILRIGSDPLETPVPLGLVAFHDDDLALGGEVFDDVVLHTFLSEQAVGHAVRTVNDAAEAAGRDPASVRVWSCLVTVGDHLPEEVRLRRTVARLANYLQYVGDEFIEGNGWDPTALRRFRGDPLVSSFTEPIEGKATPEEILRIAELLPTEWLDTCATGSPQESAARIRREFDRGVDRVILHGATPDELEPALEAYGECRNRDGEAS
ncbi:TIGR03857 family LLM class F420-dependent oxidoreductase [Streptomyces griseorubiginosus]|uniref:TIGR03857 family LLM class F420-dependent oxidoreductase n=1 Tax=Streptomyces griseorubiginosus TaxID=67304 RepID=UPI001AD71667|nr:TIGR03857 family LLM class F420-dependent oxidoreductase [Streptomyces griseorubiginosus]MBO4252315.1 TIGR03857 family LLM class F420-dependent oxidoreductase [Streptomyces griseorubiginosus]